MESLGAGLLTGGVCLILLFALLLIPSVKELERWQAGMVQGWTVIDAVAVAIFSGLAEEALIRVLLQPWIGLVFERWGYPAVATAHIVVNLVSLLRLRRCLPENPQTDDKSKGNDD